MKIQNRFNGEVIYKDKKKTLNATVIAALKNGVDLSGADLSGVDLSGSILRDTILITATFINASLSGTKSGK